MREIVHAFRKLRQAPGFAVPAILTLALGIGATSAVFSIVYTLFLRSLPFPDAGRLDSIYMSNPVRPGYEEFSFSYPNFIDIRQQTQTYSDIAGYFETPLTILGGASAEQISATSASANFFRTLGVEPLVGRTFAPEEDEPGKEFVAVLSYKFWQRHFLGDPGVIGKTLTMDLGKYVVIGVMPPDFEFYGKRFELWLPFSSQVRSAERNDGLMGLLGRRKPGVTLTQARTELNGLLKRIGAIDPRFAKDWMIKSRSIRDEYFGTIRTPILALFGASAFVLLIGCVNVANLLLARMSGRKREIAIRNALGAGRWVLVRQFCVENLVLALIGCALGLALAYGGTSALLSFAPRRTEIPLPGRIGLDPAIVLFTICLSFVTAILFGLAPSLAYASANVHEDLKVGSRGSSGGARGRRFRSFLVTLEVALAVVLLVGAGLLIQTLRQLQSVNHGYRAERVLTLTMKVPVPPSDPNRPAKLTAFYDELLRRVKTLPGVRGAGVAKFLPGSAGWMTGAAIVNGNSADLSKGIGAHFEVVSPGYFEALGIPLLQGRTFNDSDRAPALWGVVIDETFAHLFWPNGDAIGHRVALNFVKPDFSVWQTVIGVVRNVRDPVAGKEVLPHVYCSYPYQPMSQMNLLIQAGMEPEGLAATVRRQIAEIRADVPVFDVTTLPQYLSEAMWVQRLSSTVVTAFAAVALLLAAIGIYGVVNYSVGHRTREIGLRMALGAPPAAVVKLVIREGMLPAIIGMACGLLGSIALSRVIKSLLYGVSPVDFFIYTMVLVLLGVVAMLALYLPARRATRIDPIIALRED